MKIIVLSRGPKLYSTRRLVSVARRRGHSVDVIDPLELSLSVAGGEAKVYDGDWEIDAPDAVIPRISSAVTYYGLAVLRQFEAMGAATLNSSRSIVHARDKLHCMQVLSRKGIAMPDTAFSRSRSHGQGGVLDDVGGGPIVIKLLEGTQGNGVMLADSRQAATSIIDAFHTIEEDILIQRFIAESAGRDVRVLVVGKQAVAAMERIAPKGEFRSNLHRGGRSQPFDLTRKVERLAVRAARVLGLDVAGVDILLGKDGPLIIEVNPCPGLEGIEKTTGINVAGAIVDHLDGGAIETRRLRRRA